MGKILLTGVTGLVGGAFVVALLKEKPAERFVCLVRIYILYYFYKPCSAVCIVRIRKSQNKALRTVGKQKLIKMIHQRSKSGVKNRII